MSLLQLKVIHKPQQIVTALSHQRTEKGISFYIILFFINVHSIYEFANNIQLLQMLRIRALDSNDIAWDEDKYCYFIN